jgi:hypothetical protein
VAIGGTEPGISWRNCADVPEGIIEIDVPEEAECLCITASDLEHMRGCHVDRCPGGPRKSLWENKIAE